MVWAAILNNDLSELLVLRRDSTAEKKGYTARSYITGLHSGLLPIYDQSLLFQQDGAPIHTARVTMQWLRKHAIKSLQGWPPYSPDLNPIEHIWPLLKAKLYELYPDIELWHGSEDSIVERMEDALCHAWSTIRPEIASNCIASMPDRIKAVVASGGWYTRY